MLPTKKTEKIEIAAPIVAKFDPLKQAVEMNRYASLININLSVTLKYFFFSLAKPALCFID